MKHAFLASLGQRSDTSESVYRGMDAYSVRAVGWPDAALRDPILAIVRDPRDRLVSAFLSKFVRLTEETDAVTSFRAQTSCQAPVTELTFRMFLDHLLKTAPETLDGHWMPQSLFFFPERDYRCVPADRASSDADFLSFGLDLAATPVDTRLPKTLDAPEAADMTVAALRALHSGPYEVPTVESFFAGLEAGAFEALYGDDIDLYQRAATEFP